MARIKIDPEMLDIYMELLNKLMAGSETDGGNARLEVSGAGKTEDGLVRYNEEVNKLGDDLRELYGNVGEILGRIRDGTLFKNADKVSVVARSTDGAGVLAKHADEAAAWQHGGKVFRYSDETAEAVASGEKLLKESGTIYESFADMMSPEDAKRYLDFLENGSREGLTSAELAGVEKADALLVSQKVGYEDVWDLRNVGDALETSYGKSTLNSLKNTENFTDSAIEHIFEGQVNARGKAVGYHYKGIEGTSGNVIPGTESSVNNIGIYKAKVEVNGVPKTANGGFSSFYPKSMSPQEVIGSINEAYRNRVYIRGNTYSGLTSSGMEIEMFLDKNGKIISAYPVY